MRYHLIMFSAFIFSTHALPQALPTISPQLNHFEIGRHTFVDFGLPFDYYDVFIVRAAANGTSIERITLTPPGKRCIQPPQLEVTSGSLPDSVEALLDSTHPCRIPEKELRRELKRSKKYSVFSGTNVVMQGRCGAQTQVIRSDILDRDMFDPAPHTPEYTSWTIRLLARLEQALGPGVMEKPVFPSEEKEKLATPNLDPVVEQELIAGPYDVLFNGAPHKFSALYRLAQTQAIHWPVQLANSQPISPEVFITPEYPQMVKLANVSGDVSARIDAIRTAM